MAMIKIVPRGSHERIARKNLRKLDMAKVQPLIDIAIREDFGRGDPTSEITVCADEIARGYLISREEIVVSGMEMVPTILKQYDQCRTGRAELFAAAVRDQYDDLEVCQCDARD
jgi:hypothetical protein